MKLLSDYSLAELKLVYQILQQQLAAQPDLMDSQLLHDLQHFLQQQARAAGIDVSLHSEWAAWLNGELAKV